MILFYIIVYVYVCKISEKKFGGCWLSFSWLGQTKSLNKITYGLCLF